MLHLRVFLLAILATILLVSCNYDSNSKDVKEFIVQGVVLDEKVDTLYLYNHGEFGLNEGIKIPVTNGKFDYTLPIQHAQGYILNLDYSVANGGGPFLLFFVDEGITKLTIHKEEEFDQNLVVGSTINEDYQKFQNLRQSYWDRSNVYYDQLNELRSKEEFGTPSYYEIMELQKTTEDFFEKKYTYQLLDSLKKVGDYYSKAAKPLQDSINQILKEQNNWKLDFIDNHNDILGYHLLCESITYDEGLLDQKRAFETFESFKQIFPEHPYTSEFEEVINGKTNAQIGNQFVDFEAPTLSGEQKKLSELIKDKIAVIDLWGSWCAPCIVKSNKLIPVYKKYQDKGFTVVGIAAEFEDTNQLEKAIKRHKYPWINLVELDNAQDIWKKYGIRGGGAIILVDEKGEIIAINPSAYEVELEIQKRI